MEKHNDSFKIGFGIWVSICLVMCMWFLKNFIRGRQLFRNNLHVIEDGLKRMQEEIDLRQRQKSLGFEEDMKDLATFCQSASKVESEEKEKDPDPLCSGDEVKVGGVEPEEEDKKNV